MDFAFPSFTRASTDLPYTQPPQKSLLELVIEAKGRLGLVPQRKLQKRNPATAFSAFSDSDDDDEDGDGEGGRGRRRARENGDDMDAEESTYELTTRTAWVPPAYLLDHFFSRQFMSAYLTLHGIASSRAAGALAPPLLSVRDAQLHPMVESALCAVLRESAAPQTRGGGAGFYAGGSAGHGGEWSGQQGAWYGSSSSSRGSRGGRGGRGSHSRGGRHRGGGGNAGGYDAEAAQPSFSPAAGAVAPWDLARLEELGDAVFGNNGPAADSADSAAASRVLFRGLQQVALPALLLGDHVMLSGPRGVGKRTALLLAAGANALTATAAAKAEDESSGEPSEAESSGDGEGVEGGKEEAEAAQEDPTAAADEASEAPSTQAAVKRESDLDREEGPPAAPARPLHTHAASATTETAAPGVDAAPDTSPRALFVLSSYAEVTGTAQWLQRVFGPDAFVPYTFMRDEARLCPLVDAAASAGGLSDTAGASRPAFVSSPPSMPPGMAGGGAVGVAGSYLAPPAAARPLLPLITAADPTQAGVAGVLETPPSAGVLGAAGGPDLSELAALVLETPLPNAAALASAASTAAAAGTGPVERRVEGSREDITREDRKRRRSPRSPSDSRSRDSDSARRRRRRHRHHRSRYDDDDRYDSDDDYRRERKERERRSTRRSDRHRSDHGESYSRSSRSHRRSSRDRRGSYDSADERAVDSRHDSAISRTDRRTRSHRDSRDERRERRESRRDRDDSRSRSRRHHRHRDTRDRRGSYSDSDKSEGERRERSRRHRRHRSSSSSSSSSISSSIRRHRRHGDRRDRSSERETREVAGATAEGVLGDVAVTALAFPAAGILSDSLTANAASAALGSDVSHHLGTMVDVSAAATANAAVDATASLSSPFPLPPAAAVAVTEAGADLPPALAQRLPVLLTTYHGLQAAMDMVGGAASALPPLEHVRTAVFTGLDRVLAPPLKDTFPHVWWVSLVNALDVECQFMVSADRSGREVLGFLNSTVLPDAGERLLHLTQRDLAIWALMDVQVHPVPVEAAPTNTTPAAAAAAARDDGAGRGADGANQRRDGREGGERRDQRRPKISGTDIDAAKLTQLFTLLSEDRAAHATAHAAVAEAEDAADPTAASAGVSSSPPLLPASSSSASLQPRTASFSMEAPWQAVVLCSNRREQSLVVSQLASLFRDEAEALNGTPALLTDAVDVFRGGGADVLVLTDAQLSDARVLRDLHPCTGIRVLVHFSLPRSVMVQLEKAEVAEVLAQRGRAVLGHSRPFCSRRWWRQQPQQQPSSAAVVGQEFAPAKVPCWVMLTEHNMKSRIGTCVQEVLSEMADI